MNALITAHTSNISILVNYIYMCVHTYIHKKCTHPHTHTDSEMLSLIIRKKGNK